MYALLLSIIYIAFISLGLPDSLVGSGWPAMQADLGVPLWFAGFITMIIAGGTIVSSLMSERLTRRLGVGLITTISVGMTAAALIGFSFSGSFWMLCLWAIPYGLGAGAVDAALNNYVALHYAAKHMNWLHSFWGVGASISPFIMGYAISSGAGWSSAYQTVGVVQVVLVAFLFLSLSLWRRGPHARQNIREVESDAETEAPSAGHVPLSAALRIPGVTLILGAFFAYCAIESTTILWASTYLVTERGIDASVAATFAALFLLGITAGRFLSGFVADRLGDKALIRGGFLANALGITMIALPMPTDVLALAGLVIAGLGSAPIYPAIIHSTPKNFGANNSQAIIGIQMAAAYSGSTFMPPLFGALSSQIGMWIFPFYLALLVLLGMVLSERLNHRAARGELAAASREL
ncbi:MFS transporter [Glutamicibacter sp. NPDC090743]|uniref:MFS transporter n=1 Tax=Glutamicibacter sp. NPDC090743 TaxID=3364001 RepID=UPI0037FAB971